MFSIISNSVEETISLGKKLASALEKGDIVILTGDLGAGKTHFVSGILAFFDKAEEISSPTFTIINEYDLKNDLKLFHCDAYRLESPEEFLEIGGDELVDQGIVIIEWGEKLKELLPENKLEIIIEKESIDDNLRKISIYTKDKRFEKLLNV